MISAKNGHLLSGAAWIVMAFSQQSLGQTFLRTDDEADFLPLPVLVSGSLLTSVDVGFDLMNNPEGLTSSFYNRGEVFAAAGGNKLSTDEHGLASAQAGGTAMSIVPRGSTTSAPTVDASFSVQLASNSDDGHFALAALLGQDTLDLGSNGSGSGALSFFEVQGPDPQYLLHGFLQLIAVGVETGGARFLGPGGGGEVVFGNTVNARIGNWFVSAEYHGEGMWGVSGELPGVTISETTNGLNNTYNFSVPVNEGSEFDFRAGIDLDDGAFAINGTLNFSLSASAWAVATPLGEAPLPGDVDGDGDVDADDFVIIIGGQGEDFAPTLTDGDANFDGEVNGDDLQLALDNTFLAGIPGDFDDDNDIDGADFLQWQRGLGTLPIADISDGDADGDGDVDATDLGYWQQNYGFFLPPASVTSAVTVPEPSSLLLLTVLLSIICVSRSYYRF